MLTDKSKHIDVRFHHVRDCIKKEQLSFQNVASKEQKADALTKSLPKDSFILCRNAYGLHAIVSRDNEDAAGASE